MKINNSIKLKVIVTTVVTIALVYLSRLVESFGNTATEVVMMSNLRDGGNMLSERTSFIWQDLSTLIFYAGIVVLILGVVSVVKDFFDSTKK